MNELSELCVSMSKFSVRFIKNRITTLLREPSILNDFRDLLDTFIRIEQNLLDKFPEDSTLKVLGISCANMNLQGTTCILNINPNDPSFLNLASKIYSKLYMLIINSALYSLQEKVLAVSPNGIPLILRTALAEFRLISSVLYGYCNMLSHNQLDTFVIESATKVHIKLDTGAIQ
jgi:hypothetical protein